MALMTCPECGGAVSSKAPACIHCGYPLQMQTSVSKDDSTSTTGVFHLGTEHFDGILDTVKTGTEIVKNASEATKNFFEVITKFLQPKGIDEAIIAGHKKIIGNIVDSKDINGMEKLALLSGYKKMVREYKNCVDVANIAAKLISEDARPQDVEEDWFAFFFDKVRLVSDEGLQNVWGRILANEAEKPGKFQRSFIHTVSIMSAADAETFCNLSKFCVYDYKNPEIVHPLLFVSKNVKTYDHQGVTREGLLNLQSHGLIQCDFKNEFVFWRKKILRYGNKVIEIYGDPNNGNRINAGNAFLTYDGRALFDIVDDSYKRYRTEILDYIITKFQQRNCKVIINNRMVQ